MCRIKVGRRFKPTSGHRPDLPAELELTRHLFYNERNGKMKYGFKLTQLIYLASIRSNYFIFSVFKKKFVAERILSGENICLSDIQNKNVLEIFKNKAHPVANSLNRDMRNAMYYEYLHAVWADTVAAILRYPHCNIEEILEFSVYPFNKEAAILSLRFLALIQNIYIDIYNYGINRHNINIMSISKNKLVGISRIFMGLVEKIPD